MTVLPAERYFEDYHVGLMDEFGEITVTAEEIVEFASRYDPQTMHVDPDGAARDPMGGLIASGWHTAAMTMRLFVEHYLRRCPHRVWTSCAGCALCGRATSFAYV
jgi:acyl dehydratase